MKDPKDAARDLRNIYEMPFKMQLHANGQSDYSCSFGMLRQIKETCIEAAAVIENLLLERDSLLDLLDNDGGE